MAKSPIKLKVASPCSASWNEMKGDDAIRHCSSCDQKVYQISNMSSEEVETFLLSRKSRGLRTCVRFYQRADGTVLTSDCSVGKAQKRKARTIRAVGAMAVGASAVALGMRGGSDAPAPATAPVVRPVVVEPVVVEPVVVEPVVVEPVVVEPVEPEHIEMLGEAIVEPVMGDLEFVPPEE